MGRATVLATDISTSCVESNQRNMNLTSLAWTIKAHQGTVYMGVNK